MESIEPYRHSPWNAIGTALTPSRRDRSLCSTPGRVEPLFQGAKPLPPPSAPWMRAKADASSMASLA